MKVMLSFEVEAAKVPEIIKLLNGGASTTSKAGRPKKDTSDDLDLDLGEEESEDELNLDDESTEITEETLREKAKEILQAKKKPMLEKIFAKYKVKNISGVKPEKYEAFYADLQKIKI
jgi:hypothetical protein